MSEQIALEANDEEHRWRELLRPDLLGPALAQATGDPAWSDFSAELIAGGKSNLTFALSSTAGRLVLRRPPSRELLPSAHDMGREARVQRALAGRLSVPEIVLFDQSGEVLGVAFYVMREVDGWVIRDRLPDGYADDVIGQRAIADALLDQLANLHSIDPKRSTWMASADPRGSSPDRYGVGPLSRRRPVAPRTSVGSKNSVDGSPLVSPRTPRAVSCTATFGSITAFSTATIRAGSQPSWIGSCVLSATH